MARNSLPSSTLSAVSSFKRQQEPPKEPPSATPSRADQAKQAACPDCKNLFKIFTEGPGDETPNPIQCASIATGFAAAGSAYSLRPQPPRPPVRPSNQTRYPKLPHLLPALTAGDVAANMFQPDMASSVDGHQ